MKSSLPECGEQTLSVAVLKKRLWFLEKMRSLRKPLSLSNLFCFLILLLASLTAKAQPSACGNVNCTSNDVRIVSAYISGPDNAPINCADADPFHDAQLHLVISSNTQRKGISISANLNADNTTYPIAYCFTNIDLNTGSNNNLVYNLASTLDGVACGDNFSLANVFISWGTGNGNFCALDNNDTRTDETDAKCPATPAKCRYSPGETITVTVKLNPDFTSLAGDCSQGGNSLIVDFTPSYTAENITPPLAYTWDFGDPTSSDNTDQTSSDDANSGATQHTYTGPGTYTVTLTATDQSETPVTRQAIHKITVTSCCDNLTEPEAAVTTKPDCSTSLAIVTVNSPKAGITYTLTQGATTYTADASGVFSNVSPGTYTFTASDGICSIDGHDVTVDEQPPTPTATISGGSFCHSGSTQLQVTSGQTGGTFSAPSDLHIDGTGLIDLAGSTVGTYTVTYVVDNGTCTGSTTSSVTVNELPTATITGGSFCKTGTTQLQITNGPNDGTFSAPSDLHIDGTGLIDLAASTVGSYTVAYVFSDGTCTATATSSVSVSEVPTASIDGGSFCNTGTKQLTVTGQAGGTFSAPSGLNISGSGLIDLGASTVGTYTVSYSFSNGTCSSTATSSVTVLALPTLTITNQSACAPSTVNLTAAAVTAGSSSGTLSYWTDQDATSPLSTPNSVGSGTYYIKLTGSNTCYVIKPVTVTINNCTGIYPTATDCAGFNSGTIQFLPKICVSTKTTKGKTTSTTVSNATPGVFFYYTKFTAPASTFTVDVIQTKCSGLDKIFAITQSQALSFSNSCVKLNATVQSTTNGNARILIKNATAGQPVVVSVKYDTKSIVGATIGSGFPCSYSFKATQTVGVTTTDIANSTATILVTSNCSTSPVTQARPVSEDDVATFTATASPNPSRSSFTIQWSSGNNEKVILKVRDILGRIIEVRNVKTSQIEIGNSYKPGMYFVEISQGNTRQQLKLVKQ